MSDDVADGSVNAVNEAAATAAVQAWLGDFNVSLERGDWDAVAAMFVEDAYWRDLVACTWSINTMHGRSEVTEMFGALAADVVPRVLALAPGRTPEVVHRAGWPVSVEAFVVFRTDHVSGRGYVRLRLDESTGAWQAWTLLTGADALLARPEQVGRDRPSGFLDTLGDGASWMDERRAAVSYEDHHPAVIVIGGGHSGLAIAARLTVHGVDTLVVEKNDRIGDNWRNRYRSLYLHNEVWTNHLPYVSYPETWPVFTSKDKLADWLESYASTLDLNVWTGAAPTAARFDEESRTWEVDITDRDGRSRTLRPRHVVLATGVFGDARSLEFDGGESFLGSVSTSQEYVFDADSLGKRVLVIGTGSSAHDIARDYCENGAEVTLLQRSSTTVISVDPGARMMHAGYAQGGRPTEDSDLIGIATPIHLVRKFHKELYKTIAQLDQDLINGLNNAGFRTDYGDDESGYMMKYYERGGGYYIDVGCSKLIVDGKIKVKNGVEVDHLDAEEVVFTDGSRLKADVVVVAVGFANMQESVRRLMGDHVADKVGPVWGLDEYGELRALWRPTGQEALWIMGGSFVQCRPMSKALALQLVAREEGLPIKIMPAPARR